MMKVERNSKESDVSILVVTLLNIIRLIGSKNLSSKNYWVT